MNISFTKKDILERGVSEIIEEKSLKKKLNSGRKLRVKLGIDPTGPDLHLGHTVNLWKLRQFQDLGHKVVLIIGDFTATIGDPSGQNKERTPLTKQEVKRNMKGYIEQAGKILDIKKTEIRYNSEWHEKEGLDAAIKLGRTATYQQLTRRADFQERIKRDDEITFMELFYPLLQGYDSVKVKADVEIGGTDQKFNLLMGRQVQRKYGQKEQDIITLPLLLGIDGVKKMSKSEDNYISLQESADDIFGKVMRITDDEITTYYELVSPASFAEVKKIKKEKVSGKKARDLKFELALLITEFYKGKEKAEKAAEKFETMYKKNQTPEDIPESTTQKKEWNIVELIVDRDPELSKGEARRLVRQGAVYFNNKKVENADAKVKLSQKDNILRIGKRKHYMLHLEN